MRLQERLNQGQPKRRPESCTKGVLQKIRDKARKFKPEMLLDILDKLVRNACILFQFLYKLFSWLGCLYMVGIVGVTLLYQWFLMRPIVDQEDADTATTRSLEDAGLDREQLPHLTESLDTLARHTIRIGNLRAIRELFYISVFYAFFQWTDEKDGSDLLAAYKYMASIREVVDKLSSWWIQLDFIVPYASRGTWRVALMAWWVRDSEGAARIIKLGIRGKDTDPEVGREYGTMTRPSTILPASASMSNHYPLTNGV